MCLDHPVRPRSEGFGAGITRDERPAARETALEVKMKPTYVLALLVGCSGPDDPGKQQPGPDPEPAVHEPGVRTLGRLNAVEYDTIVRDLFGTELQPGRNFPPDEIAFGFDNIGEALTTTSTHVELWEGAADQLLDEMFGRKLESTMDYGVQAEDAGVTYLGRGEAFDDYAYALYDGSLSAAFSLPYDGTFEITVGAFGRPDGVLDPTMEIRVDGQVVGTFDVTNVIGDPEAYLVEAELSTGLHNFEVAIGNPVDGTMLALVVDYVKVRGPTDPQTGRTAAYDRFVPCALDGFPSRGCAEEAVADFGRIAWRRPLTTDEVTWAVGLYDNAQSAGLDQGESLQYAFKGLLMSPEFLFRPERDPEDGDSWTLLDGYEVATRLAQFAWSGTPDEELLDASDAGELGTPEGVQEQLARMLADEKADALVSNLAGQWFAIRKLEGVSLDTELYPGWDDELRASMQQELVLLMNAFFRDGAPLSEVLTRQTTFVDQRLADAYRLPFSGAPGEWQEVSTNGTDRFGLLGTAGWLAANSRSDGPSAVKRGKWVLENLMCSPPPPPPPNVEGNVVIVPDEGSVRAQEEQVRSDAFCQSCHSQMDPLGFALNKFDALGIERSEDELGYPIDDYAEWNGVEIDGPAGLAEVVAADPRLPRCVVEKTFTYAIGRGVTIDDGPMIDAITAEFIAGGQTFESLAAAIVESDAFRLRGAEVK
jgi:hypothetical protein